MIQICGRGLRSGLWTAKRRARTAAQDKMIAAISRGLRGSDALDGRLRPGLLSALTPIAASEGHPVYLFSTRDREIGWSTYRNHGFDEHKSDWVVARLGQCQRDRIVLDIGANIGTVAIPMVTKYGAAHAVAFEPEPLNHRLLRCNVALNDVEDHVTCIAVAVSDTEQLVQFELSESNYGDHRVRVPGSPLGVEYMREGQRAIINVPAMPLTRALEDAKVDCEDVGLVWVDTQGHEGQVLAGADRMSGIPFVMEYWPYGLRRSNGLELFHEHVAKMFSRVIDIKRSIDTGADVTYAASDIERVAAALVLPRSHTDLLLLP